MGRETTKSNKFRRRFDKDYVEKFFVGNGIDIGGGGDPLKPCDFFPNIKTVDFWDKRQGDAQLMETDKTYDFVYSSNCLEHLANPYVAIKNWWKILKDGGHLIVCVPDEDLYEQGFFPSRYNPEHMFTFTILKRKSWTNKSINVTDLIYTLDNFIVKRIILADSNYDYSLNEVDQTLDKAEAFVEFVLQKKDC